MTDAMLEPDELPGPDPEKPDELDELVVPDLSGDELRSRLDEDGRPLDREDEMVEPADSEDLEYREDASDGAAAGHGAPGHTPERALREPDSGPAPG